MKLLTLAPAALAALLLAAPAARAEEAALREPEILPDEYFEWTGYFGPTGLNVSTGANSPYYRGFELNIGCLHSAGDGVVSMLSVDFDFGRYRHLRSKGRKAAVLVGFWSQFELAGVEGYSMRHDVEIYEAAERASSENMSRVTGAAAHDLIRKIHRADSVSWTDVETGRASRPNPVTDKGRALLERAMDFCGISHEASL